MRRKCGQCGAVLNQHNQGTLCFPCQEKKQEELTEKMGDSLNYDIYDICSILGLSPEQVRRLGRKRIIPGKIPGIRKHLYLKAAVDPWIRSGGKVSKPEVVVHYSELSIAALKLAEILDYYYKAHQFNIGPLISTDFPYTTHLPESPILNKREFSNLMDHLKGEVPELVSIAEYPSACKQYFARNSKSENEMPTAAITGDLILKLKLMANQGSLTGRCPDCPS
ncbi:hypothetical protein HY626_02580 [Candidatus Uhrbacteria bacterium]|nr:hypothetical protein [Candidatus Uhrbacteria bacterium]